MRGSTMVLKNFKTSNKRAYLE